MAFIRPALKLTSSVSHAELHDFQIEQCSVSLGPPVSWLPDKLATAQKVHSNEDNEHVNIMNKNTHSRQQRKIERYESKMTVSE